MVSLVRSIIALASDFGLPANFEDCWFWIELPENCCEPLKFIMKYISIQFCEWPGHGRPFHALVVVYSTTQRKTHLKQSTFSHRSPCKTLHQLWIQPAATAKIATVQTRRGCYNTKSLAICPSDGHACLKAMCFYWLWRIERLVWWCEIKYWITPILHLSIWTAAESHWKSLTDKNGGFGVKF